MNRRQIILASGALAAGTAAAAGAASAAEPPAGEPPALPGPGGRRGIPVPGSVPAPRSATDYTALRARRMTELDDEMRLVYGGPGGPPKPDALQPGVKAYDIEIPGPARPLGARVYMPEAKSPGPIGVYLHTHGGGWAMNSGLVGFDAENSQRVLDWGCAVVQVDFRVPWEAKFPAAVDDCFAAYKYLLAEGSRMGLDVKRIGIGGGCTGANLATVVSLMARDAGIQKPAVQWLWTPVFDTRNDNQSYDEFGEGYVLTRQIADTVTNFYLSKREDRYDWRSSPLLARTMRGASPAIIWVGAWEVLRDEARQYRDRMVDAGCKVHYFEGEHQSHAGIYARNPKTGEPTAYSRRVLPEINAIMRQYIGPRKS